MRADVAERERAQNRVRRRVQQSVGVRMMREKGYRVVNLDSTISLEKPKLRPHIEAMRRNLAEILEIGIDSVSVKAKTGESVDAVGERRAIKAEAVVLLTTASG